MANVGVTMVRDRIRELRRLPASELKPHPKNWRRHGARQRAALAGVLHEVGFADALLARACDDGTLELVDGHLRADLSADAVVPVLVLDLSEREADLLLATLDPLAALADADAAALGALVSELQTDQRAVVELLTELTQSSPVGDDGSSPGAGDNSAANDCAGVYEVVAACDDEAAQQALFERLSCEGYRCRLVVMPGA